MSNTFFTDDRVTLNVLGNQVTGTITAIENNGHTLGSLITVTLDQPYATITGSQMNFIKVHEGNPTYNLRQLPLLQYRRNSNVFLNTEHRGKSLIVHGGYGTRAGGHFWIYVQWGNERGTVLDFLLADSLEAKMRESQRLFEQYFLKNIGL